MKKCPACDSSNTENTNRNEWKCNDCGQCFIYYPEKANGIKAIGQSVTVNKLGSAFDGMTGVVIGHTTNPGYDTRVQFIRDTEIFHHCHLR